MFYKECVKHLYIHVKCWIYWFCNYFDLIGSKLLDTIFVNIEMYRDKNFRAQSQNCEKGLLYIYKHTSKQLKCRWQRIYSFETYATTYPSTHHHIVQDQNPHQYHCENLNSYNNTYLSYILVNIQLKQSHVFKNAQRI